VRIVQFGETEFKRFDPKIAEPRATHEYKEIQKLGLVGDDVCVLLYYLTDDYH
jgi:hypothetical protein